MTVREGKLEVRILEEGRETSARVHLLDSRGKWVYPTGTVAYEKDRHFTADGGFSTSLPAGRTEILLGKGKEYREIRDEFFIPRGGAVTRVYNLERWVNMEAMGWFSGETHVHRDPEAMAHLMEAEDLNVAPVITFWNQRLQVKAAEKGPKLFCRGNRCFSIMTQEDERAGGAVLGLNVAEHVQQETGKWYPPQAFFCRKWREQGAVVEEEKPFWWEAPVNVALGLVDTVGVINNHLQRGEVMEDEAWGRPRDHRAFPGKEGFVRYVLDLYYRYLNLGIKLPLAAGSASGVLRNPLGYNRLYVYFDGRPFSYDGWFDGMLRGRAFATNGPMLFFRVNDEIPPMTMRFSSSCQVSLDVRALSSAELDSLEIVRDGRVVERFAGEGKSELRASLALDLNESSWVACRSYEKNDRTVRLAHTNPVFLELGGPLAPSRADALFYRDWCIELLESSKGDADRYGSEEERAEVEGLYKRAISFYEDLAGSQVRPEPGRS